MTGTRVSIFLLSLLLLSGTQLHAKDVTEMPVGSVVENAVTIGKKQVPLLKGRWEVLYSSQKLHWTNGTPVGGVVLIRKSGETFEGGIYIRTNLQTARGSGWVRPTNICDRTNVHFNESDSNYNSSDADCWQVNHFVVTRASRTAPVHGEFAQWIADNVSTSSLVTLQYWHNDYSDFVRVHYFFDPTQFGFPTLLEVAWSASDWHSYVVKGDPQREGFIAAVKALGEKLHVPIRQGFRNRLDGYVADLDLEYPR